MNKQILIDAIIGRGLNPYVDAIKYEKLGLARFCGNQWNEDWMWIREKLESLTETELITIYNRKV